MANLYLIRHGQASFGADDYDQLSDLGIEQAILTGEHLRRKMDAPCAIYSGTMTRHLETAEHSLKAFADTGLSNMTSTPLWNEYDHQVILAALDSRFATPKGIKTYLAQQTDGKAALKHMFTDAISRWIGGEHDADYAESWPQFKKRIATALNEVIEASAGQQNVLVYTSGGAISYVLLALQGLADGRFLQTNWTLANCGVTKLVVNPNRQWVATMNEHCHFEGESFKHLLTYK